MRKDNKMTVALEILEDKKTRFNVARKEEPIDWPLKWCESKDRETVHRSIITYNVLKAVIWNCVVNEKEAEKRTDQVINGKLLVAVLKEFEVQIDYLKASGKKID